MQFRHNQNSSTSATRIRAILRFLAIPVTSSVHVPPIFGFGFRDRKSAQLHLAGPSLNGIELRANLNLHIQWGRAKGVQSPILSLRRCDYPQCVLRRDGRSSTAPESRLRHWASRSLAGAARRHGAVYSIGGNNHGGHIQGACTSTWRNATRTLWSSRSLRLKPCSVSRFPTRPELIGSGGRTKILMTGHSLNRGRGHEPAGQRRRTWGPRPSASNEVKTETDRSVARHCGTPEAPRADAHCART